jgi:hypothetical protein
MPTQTFLTLETFMEANRHATLRSMLLGRDSGHWELTHLALNNLSVQWGQAKVRAVVEGAARPGGVTIFVQTQGVPAFSGNGRHLDSLSTMLVGPCKEFCLTADESPRRWCSIYIPNDQTALLLKGDTFSRRDYVFIYTGNILAATVKGRYKRVWVGEHPGLSGAAFFDLYTDPREHDAKMLPMFPAKGMFTIIKTRHDLWMLKYPNIDEARAFPLTGIENARPETIAAGKPRVDVSKLPFDPFEFIDKLPQWDNIAFDKAE